MSHYIHILLRLSGAEDDGAYYYTNEDGRGFFFTDDCSNDEFEIRYVSGGAYQEVLGALRLDIDPATPSSIHQDRKSYGVFYTALLLVVGGSIVLCAIVLSVVYSRGHSVGGLYAAALERYSYDGVRLGEEDERSMGEQSFDSFDSNEDGDHEPNVLRGMVTMSALPHGGRKNRRIARSGVVCSGEEETIYL
jgi:hypothetical protein